MSDYTYSLITGDKLTLPVAEELSRVFSSSYGRWSALAPKPLRPGDRIRMSPTMYMRDYAKHDIRFAMCRRDGELVGQAIFVERETSRGRVALVVQLVVLEAHRHRGIATMMLHSIFGFSDYYAWAVVTSSPCTIEALESATFRRGEPRRISQDRELLSHELLSSVPFLAKAAWNIDETRTVLNTSFWTDRSHVLEGRTHVRERYGELPEGCEWLAVVFRDQELSNMNAYSRILECSGNIVFDAYRRMPQARQGWAKNAAEEVDCILQWIPKLAPEDPICDFGAGGGRHLKALQERGYKNVCGIDHAVSEDGRGAGVIEGDCRTWRGDRLFCLVLCLYDVIGSFADDAENKKILSSIEENLADDGYAVITVANSDFAGKKHVEAIDAGNREDLLRSVFRLMPTKAMATDGEFFESQSLWDKKAGLFYHKEQFRDEDGGLPGEYLVVDRRFTDVEFEEWISQTTLRVVMKRFARSGFSKEYTRETGKEILFVVKKTTGQGPGNVFRQD